MANNYVPSIPLFQLTTEQAEPIFKKWIAEVLKAIEPPQDVEPVFFTRYDAKRILHISLPTVDNYTKKGILKCKRVGNRILYSKDDINQALKDLPSRKYKRA